MSVAPAGAIASLETRNFSFEAHGTDDADALDAMDRLLKEHGRVHGLPEDWAGEYEIGVRAFTPGIGYRDGFAVSEGAVCREGAT